MDFWQTMTDVFFQGFFNMWKMLIFTSNNKMIEVCDNQYNHQSRCLRPCIEGLNTPEVQRSKAMFEYFSKFYSNFFFRDIALRLQPHE